MPEISNKKQTDNNELTDKQFNKLVEFGFSPQNWSLEQASEVISLIESNGWKVPDTITPTDYKPPVEQNNESAKRTATQAKNKYTKVTLSSEMRKNVGNALLEKGIDFSSSVNEKENTTSFNIRTEDMPKFQDILKQISMAAKEQSEPVHESKREEKTENGIVEEPTKSDIDVSDSVGLLNSLLNKINTEITSADTEYIINPIEKAANALFDVENNIKKNEPIHIREKNELPADIGNKISPILSVAINSSENRMKSLAEKNDTLQNKIVKNQSRIEKLSDKADSLKHSNDLLLAMKKNVPMLAKVASSLIENNNKKIENITKNKIPKREKRIEKHKSKIAKNEKKLAKTMRRYKVIGAMNRLLTGKLSDKRREFSSLVSTMAEYSLYKAVDKRNNAIEQLTNLSKELVAADRISVTQLADNSSNIDKLSNIISSSQQKIMKSQELLHDLDKISRGEMLESETKLDKVIENTQETIAESISNANIADDSNINKVTDNIIDEVVDNMTAIIKQEVQPEIAAEKDTRISLFSIEQADEVKYYINDDNSFYDIMKTIADSEHPFVDISKCGKPISIEEYAQIEQSNNFASSIEINMNEQTVTVTNVDGHISDPDRNSNNCKTMIHNLKDTIKAAKDSNGDKDYFECSIEVNYLINNLDNTTQQETLVRDERTPEADEKDIESAENREEKILNEIAVATGYTSSQLNVLPKDIKADLIAEYDRSGGQISTSTFAQEIASILNVEPPKQEISQPVANVKTQKSEKDESTKTIEELVEGNANSIDGIINNEKPKQEKIKEVSRFSLKDLHSDKYTPRSNKSEEQEQQKKDRGRDI